MMGVLTSKSSTGEQRERDDYNGARTALTADEWDDLAEQRHGAFVLVVDERVEARDQWATIRARFAAEDKTGHRVRVMSHTDFVMRRLAECLVVAL